MLSFAQKIYGLAFKPLFVFWERIKKHSDVKQDSETNDAQIQISWFEVVSILLLSQNIKWLKCLFPSITNKREAASKNLWLGEPCQCTF